MSNELTSLDFSKDMEAQQVFASEDLQIPFIRILQSNSPQLKKAHGDYIAGAQEGDLFNTVTLEVVPGDQGVVIIPCNYTRNYIEWNLLEDGGGFVASHPLDTPLLQQCTRDNQRRMITPSSTQLVETAQYAVLVLDTDQQIKGSAVIAMSATNLSIARKWNTMISNMLLEGKVKPMFSQIYRLTTTPRSNDRGSWYAFKVQHEQEINRQALYTEAKQFHAIASGLFEPRQPPAAATEVSSSDTAAA